MGKFADGQTNIIEVYKIDAFENYYTCGQFKGMKLTQDLTYM